VDQEIKLQSVIDFGRQPIANGFLTADGFPTEYFYQMVLGYDPATHAIGLVHRVSPERMFHDNYAFFSSTSRGMQAHFHRTAEKLLSYAGGGIVVEIGSNDGIMLEAWKQLGVRAIGVEPSRNVAEASRARGHEVITEFMSDTTADQVLAQGRVSLVFGANVSCHVEGFPQYLRAVTRLIGRTGVFVFEDPYFIDIVEKSAYDQIYDEHVWYFTVSFINAMLDPLGYHVFDCEHHEAHGGELRMYVAHKDTHPVRPAVGHWLARESDLEAKLDVLRRNTEQSRKDLIALLAGLRDRRRTVCGFGATSKATTIFNYCGIGPELIPFVTDNTPGKQGKCYPGVHIPVVPQAVFERGRDDTSRLIDYAFLCAWNHAKEIRDHQAWYEAAGGRWITHVPVPHVL
jgi:methylation protein EvaC